MKTLVLAALATGLMATSALSSDIETRKVSFENEGVTLSGTLYLPSERQSGDKLPVVVVTGAWTSVQEQMPETYARKMVERGFAAFTFDFRGWGKSGDLPKSVRFVESPDAKTSDIREAFAFVATLPEIDSAQIHGLGICASSGYMVDAVAGNPLVRRIGLVAPWLQNSEIVEAVYGGAEGVAGLIDVSRAAAAKGGEIIRAAGPEGAQGVLMPIGGYYYEADRGAIPEYDDKWNNAGWEGWLTYHPADNPQRLDKPLAVVHSEAAAIPQGVRAFLQGFAGDATTQWLEGVSQFDFYDNPEDVERSADTVADHFRAATQSKN
ncbi:alpha/beta hydrolase [Hoeflea prorocentri]|uniref:Alpha/beta hydrolase n=1 Tax=Hoeflea prorocentri TaxID=1922333 RepID=A0A9X3ULX2_9HYPH|nr:alpha/beta hydrolase [Hoeflea prorocentri]MCY6381604.1 alpha/beta hydrolase [Hoeflea prorocentri]MDA5399404.1 alpha/beta hydrolase [Hoeflea prorocentri]